MSEQDIKTVSFKAPPEFTKKYRELSIVMGVADNGRKIAIRHNDGLAMSKYVADWENADSELDDLIFQTIQPLLKLEDVDISRLNNVFILLSGNVIQLGILFTDASDSWKDES